MAAIRVMPDYACWPLWDDAGQGGNIDPATLPIPQALVAALAAWAAWFEAGFDWADPAASPPMPDPDAFEAEGRRLAAWLARELGPAWRVRYWRDQPGAG
ncbi:hypothetical protein [Falsiroseomonas ponticola]|uniref:hypothetical protein n=1 Tax=Falsiroseomonas ponticola TaxID=2786951 RepID=UPI001932111C|nr:hypothetical protein [Roseomonas ponticola]